STPARGVATLLLLVLAASPVALAPPRPAHADAGRGGTSPHPSAAPVPVLAYYYIWFNPTSWNRAKIDYPLLGHYSSDDVEIMRRHIRMAKTAGINGFLVSWKHTPQLDERLAKLVEVAREEKFRLGIVYQGLDFSRTPLAFDTVRTDLSFFASRYATEPVFDIFGRPLVIWTGSDRFTAAQIEETVGGVRGKLLVLGNAKNLEDVESSHGVLDGQAYYWSSVDPVAGTSAAKLTAMSRAVHQRGGLWIAPVTPGFDARLVGGKREVPRRNGDTLRASFAAARLSEPDAIGVISWNEFSENTHIEPSERFGSTDINVLADLLGVRVDVDVPVDSSEPGDGGHWGLTASGALLFAGAAVVLLPLGVAFRRRRPPVARDGRTAGTGPDDPSADPW
ncbi:endo-1,3-alpha-glucanase family glycosylhydrolase, partial [Micromonospora globispora]|uniref:endo-1,3-alpha-glucanase family glycosylhydrolase n=1 Tax=Micromonospora globispora TaxID=1450148 RepID=UPI0010579BD4